MLTGRTSVYIDTVRTDEETPPEPSPPSKESKHAPVKRSANTVGVEQKGTGSNQAHEPKETKTSGEKKDKKGSLDRNAFGKFIMCFGKLVMSYMTFIVIGASR